MAEIRDRHFWNHYLYVYTGYINVPFCGIDFMPIRSVLHIVANLLYKHLKDSSNM